MVLGSDLEVWYRNLVKYLYIFFVNEFFIDFMFFGNVYRNVLDLMLEIFGCVFRKNFLQSNFYFEFNGNNFFKWN